MVKGAAVAAPVADVVKAPVAGVDVTAPVAGAAVTPPAVLGEAPVAVDNAPPAAGVSDLVVLVASSNIVGPVAVGNAPVAVGNAPVAAVVDVPPARVNVLSAPEAFPDAKLFVTGIAANAASYCFFDSNILFLADSS